MSANGVQVPVTNQKSQAAISLANYLRDNKALKQRTGLLNNKEDIDFFRFKRFVRLLTSDEYKKKQSNPKNGLMPINSEKEAVQAFIMLIQGQFVIPINKLHFKEIKETNPSWKPNRSKPTLTPSNKANLEPNAYFAWTYTKPNPFMLLYGILLIVGIFAVILFPLWPSFMKVGVWYLSMAFLGLIALFFAIAIVRLIIYVITLLALPRAFWLYPNLFEDCGVLESFQPLYGWEEPKKDKKKKSKSKKGSVTTTGDETTTTSKSTGTDSNTTAVRRKVTLEEVDE
ncbi:translocation protein Sec62p [[Candida] anglica]|uniref:Translocation protein SEC62 n=1 Tax=[Candida] anglica TaxID=148631 RepID=A0ABP0EBG6_9ASCO